MHIQKTVTMAIALSLAMVSGSPAFADGGGRRNYFGGHVTWMRTTYYNSRAYTAFSIDGDGGLGGMITPDCTGVQAYWGSARFSFNSSSPIYKDMLAVLIAAMLSGRPVTGWVPDCSGISGTGNVTDLGMGTD